MKKIASLIIISLGLCFVFSCQNKSEPTMKKYDWIATENAPKEYPMRIYSGILYSGKQDMTAVPEGTTINYGWGEAGSVESSGETLKAAPNTLDLTWISFTENKNYTGKFPLNVKLIDSLFSAGYPAEDLPAGHDDFFYFKVGMAPGGVVVLWLSGPGKQVEVGRYQGKEISDVDWKSKIPGYDGTMKEYGKHIIADLPKEVQQQIVDNKIPYGKWDHWRRRFSWKPVITGDADILRVTMFMFNKEMDFLIGKRLNPVEYIQRGALEKLYIFWVDHKKREMRSQIDFDETETDQIFSALKPGENCDLLLHVANDGEVTVNLKTAAGVIPFKKAKINTYLR